MSNLKNLLASATAAAALLGSGVALADAPFHRTNDETGSIMHGTEYRHVNGEWKRVDVWNNFDQPAPAREPLKIGEISADGLYEYMGQEEGWRLRPHRYDFRGGRLVHADNFPHDTPRPSIGLSASDVLEKAPVD